MRRVVPVLLTLSVGLAAGYLIGCRDRDRAGAPAVAMPDRIVVTMPDGTVYTAHHLRPVARWGDGHSVDLRPGGWRVAILTGGVPPAAYECEHVTAAASPRGD